MAEDQTTTVETEQEIKGKTVISFTKPTPMWATWIFRAEFFMNKAFLMAVSQGLMPTIDTKVALAWAVIIDFVVWGMAKGIGVDKKQFEDS